MAEAFTDEQMRWLQDWVDGKLPSYPLGHDANESALIFVRGFLDTTTADRKEIKILKSTIETDNAIKKDHRVQMRADRKRIEELEIEVDDFHLILEIQRSRCRKAEDLWRKAHNKPHTIPDLGKLIEWLLGQIADQTAVIERLRGALEPLAPTYDILDNDAMGIFLGGLTRRNFVEARQALDAGKEEKDVE